MKAEVVEEANITEVVEVAIAGSRTCDEVVFDDKVVGILQIS
jgi:hypothetical protein